MSNEIITFQTIQEYAQHLDYNEKYKGDGFMILPINNHENQEAIKMGPFRYGFYELVITTNYHEKVSIGNTTFESRNRDILSCSSPGQVISWQAEPQNHEGRGYVVLFTPEFLHPSDPKFAMWERYPIFSITNPSYFELSKDHKDLLFPIFDNLFMEYQSSDTLALSISSAYLQVALLKINQLLSSTKINRITLSRADEITIQLEDAVRLAKRRNLSVAEYASRLNISPVYLAECIKKSTGKTVKNFITSHVILEAKSLLLQTSLTIEEIAYHLHFSSQSNFIKFFKQKTEETPSSFRRKG